VVAIAGSVNVGKSSILNRLAGRSAAIVSPHAGTTRDVIEVSLDLGGYPVTILDTAGIRASDDPVEQEGMRRARERASQADLTLWVVDATDPDRAPPPMDDREQPPKYGWSKNRYRSKDRERPGGCGHNPGDIGQDWESFDKLLTMFEEFLVNTFSTKSPFSLPGITAFADELSSSAWTGLGEPAAGTHRGTAWPPGILGSSWARRCRTCSMISAISHQQVIKWFSASAFPVKHPAPSSLTRHRSTKSPSFLVDDHTISS
jgi:hypothetical protein